MKGGAVAGKTIKGQPITLDGVEYSHGVGCSDISMLRINLKGAATRFETVFNVDDVAARRGQAHAFIFVDGKLVYQTPPASGHMARKEPYRISVDLAGASNLVLVGTAEVGRSIFTDWAEARIVLDPAAKEPPESVPLADDLVEASHSKSEVLWLDQIYHAYISSGDARVSYGHTSVGSPIILSGTFHSRGVVVRPRSYSKIDLKGAATRFHALVGVNDGSQGSVIFRVTADNKLAYDSGPMRAGDPLKDMDVDLRGARELELTVDGVPGDPKSSLAFAVWTRAGIELRPDVRKKKDYPQPELPDQNPMPIAMINDGPEPVIHGPIITGASPGHRMFFHVPATGDQPLRFFAEDLPEGLAIDRNTGIITGVMDKPVKKLCRITVRNDRGETSRALTIVCAPYAMALTPPLGWNAWNQWEEKVDEAKIKAAADAMVAKGFAAHGFSYVNIDDHWEGTRTPAGIITVNTNRFSDMKALCEYIHARGLKFGIYSSPGPTTCGKCLGSYGHEAQDANTWASWGVDYLKYDGCSGNHLPDLAYRWRLMRHCLDATGRDFVYSVNTCRDPSAHAQLWRTTSDIHNTWECINEYGFVSSLGSWKYAGPGRYNDPDMLVVGHPAAVTPRPELTLTHNEQITHITQWCMLAAPLLLGCDLTKADDFLVSLMCNDDVLAIDQDPLVSQGRRLRKDPPVEGGGGEIWVRPLFDGTTAVAFYNRNAKPIHTKVTWKEIGRHGPQPVRNCWLRKDMGTFPEGYETRVETHAAVLIKVGKPETDQYMPD